MNRVLLVSPPAAAPTRTLPLSLLYLAAALRRAQVDVQILDMASPFGPRGVESLMAVLKEWKPTIVGMTLYAETALAAYRVLNELGPQEGLVRVAGGPHATVVPEEAIAHGFDVVVRGEGEQTLVELLQAVNVGADLSQVRGLTYRCEDGEPKSTSDHPRLADLDLLPPPTEALDLFPRSWYHRSRAGRFAPAIISSRGCPQRCTFCAKHVSGHRYRAHSVPRVIEEMLAWYRREQVPAFTFHDASLTIDRTRLHELCTAMQSLPFRPMWWCEARIDQLDLPTARAMARAGCISVIVGIESGDQNVLQRYGKGIELDSVAGTLKSLKQAGLRTQVNFMFGFPDETVTELENTLRFMERIAPLVDFFSWMGIVIPYPETPTYEEHHQRLGFTQWWLDEDRLERLEAVQADVQGDGSVDSPTKLQVAMEQALLDARIIPYADDVYRAIQRCLSFRVKHNRDKLAGMQLG